ncbi:hypothetical protein Zm00014a_035163, partial [Zea mays]
NTINKKEQIV